MHTSTELDVTMFDIAVDGAGATAADLFPDWHALDRLGVVVTSPLGALGASHLIQVAITCFYDLCPARRAPDTVIYPEIYALHVGRAWGDHSAFDFWPARKEVVVADDAREVLDAVNDKGITRLLVVDSAPRPVHHRPKERSTARDRIRSTFAYSPTGRTSAPDVTIAGIGRATESNTRKAVDPAPLLAAYAEPSPPRQSDGAFKEGDADYRRRLRSRLGEVTPADRAAVAAHRRALAADGVPVETYRRIELDTALDMLAGRPDLL